MNSVSPKDETGSTTVIPPQFLPAERKPVHKFSIEDWLSLPMAVVGMSLIMVFISAIFVIITTPGGRTGFFGSEMSLIEIPLYGLIIAFAYMPTWAVYITGGITSFFIGSLVLLAARKKIELVMLAPIALAVVVAVMLGNKQGIFELVKPVGEYGREMSYQNFTIVFNAFWGGPLASLCWAIYILRKNR